MKHLVRLAALAAVVVGLTGSTAQAALTPSFVSATGPAGNVTWTYDVFETTGVALTSGDTFTVQNFYGLNHNSFSTVPPLGNWNYSDTNGGASGYSNFTVTYSGFSGAPNPGPNPIKVLTFTVQAQYAGQTAGNYTWQTLSPSANGTGGVSVASIPEPTQLAMAGVVGLFVLGGRILRRRKAS